MQYKAICLTICSLLLYTPFAQALTVCGAPKQGGFVKVFDDGLRKVVLNGRTYQAGSDGKLALAFGRDADLRQELKLYYHDGGMVSFVLPLAETPWDVQKIDGVASSKVTPAKSDTAEIERERKAVAKALTSFSDMTDWDAEMVKPVEGRTSGYFGGQRIMNGVKKNPHQGWDIAAPEGTEVKAAAGGVVTLSDGPFFYSGNMVVVEHGQNLSTIYAHLQKVLVKAGDRVEKGQVIGLVGKTGRATGPHLHLGASLNGVRFDAQNLLNIDDENCTVYKDVK